MRDFKQEGRGIIKLRSCAFVLVRGIDRSCIGYLNEAATFKGKLAAKSEIGCVRDLKYDTEGGSQRNQAGRRKVRTSEETPKTKRMRNNDWGKQGRKRGRWACKYEAH